LTVALALALSMSGCAAMTNAYVDSRPFVRASVDDANFEARNFSTVTGSVGVDPRTGAHTVSVTADRSEGWKSVTKWVAGLFGVLSLGK
jgi:hypothetical protein